MTDNGRQRPKLWKLLPTEDKKGVVRTLLKAGYTREAVGKALGTTKNAIVGYQHRVLPKLTGKSDGTLEEVPEEVLRQLVASIWPLEESDDENAGEADDEMISRIERASREAEAKRPKMAATETTQCAFIDPRDRQRCGFEWTDPITHRCDAHKKLR